MEKVRKLDGWFLIWHVLALVIFFSGIFEGNWYKLVGGFLMTFNNFEIVHWQGMKYE